VETEVAHFQYRGEYVDLAAPKGDHITRILRRGTFYEIDLLEAIRELEIEGPYVDCGAHVGNHSVYFARFCKSTEVCAVECNLDLIPFLDKNFGSLGAMIQVYVGDGEPVRWVPGPELNVGMGKTVPGGDIPTRTLAQICPDDTALVKLDLEGAEPRVLRASRDWIMKHRPVIVAEAVDPAEIDDLLGWPRMGPYALTPTWIWRAP